MTRYIMKIVIKLNKQANYMLVKKINIITCLGKK